MSGGPVEFVLTDEQEELRRVVRRFVEARSSESVVRERMATERI